MRFGLALPHYDFSFPDGEPVSFARTAEFARLAERLGFDSVWISDHFFLSLERYGGGGGLSGSLEPLTTLAALAPLTERVRLGTLVLGAPFRHPANLAKMATAVDILSGGRLELGIGAGWYEAEFGAFGFEFTSTGERFAHLGEVLEVLTLLFQEGPADFDGDRFHLRGAYNHPLPASKPRPPIWVGAKGGSRALRLAAKHADGWNTVWRWSPEAYGDRVAEARRTCEEENRDPNTLRLSVGLYTLVGEDPRDLVARFRALQRWTPGGALDGEPLEDFARDALVGTPEAVLETLTRFAALGVEEMIVSAGSLPFAVFDESMLELFAEAVIPAARTL
jgi:probable F420-dependent oxidoreductase